MAAALPLAAIVLVGVSGQPASAQKLPKDLGAYIADADKLCAETNIKLLEAAKKIETAKARSTKGGRLKKVNIAKPKQVSSFISEVALPALTELGAQLRDIPSPKGQETQIATLIGGFEKGLADLQKDPDGAVFDDPLKASSKAFGAVRFGEVKFTACGVHINRDVPKK